MPADAHRAIERSARKRGIRKGTDRWRRYVYGTLGKIKRAQAQRQQPAHKRRSKR